MLGAMKRSAALTPLSRDHHGALKVALGLRRADAATVDAAVEAFAAFYNRKGRRHFEREEAAFVPGLCDDPAWPAGVQRMVAEHGVIRRAAGELDAGEDRVAAARALGDLLHDHVRFEERELFEILERRLSPDELERLGAALR